MSFTLQQSQFLSPLLGDGEIAALFSVEADFTAMLEFEMALAAAQAKLGFIPSEAATEISTKMKSFVAEQSKLREGAARDGMTVPALVTQLKAQTNQHIHFGATSQDVIDTSLMLRAKKSFAIFSSRTGSLLADLDKLAATFGSKSLMARTRMQQAFPFTAADRIASWRNGIEDTQAATATCHFPLQFGGPIGVLGEFGAQAQALKFEFAERLNLEVRPQNWQSNRAPIIALANA